MMCGKSCPNWKLWLKASEACACCVNAESHHGQSRVTATDYTLAQRRPIDYTREPSGQATDLAPDAEDKLRRAMATLFALDPIDLMLVAHLVQQRPLTDFGDVLSGVERTIRGYRGRVGAMAFARKERLLAKMPQLRAVIRTNTERDAASRIEEELES